MKLLSEGAGVKGPHLKLMGFVHLLPMAWLCPGAEV